MSEFLRYAIRDGQMIQATHPARCRHLVDPERPHKTRCGQVIAGDRRRPLETTETPRGGDCNGCRKLWAFGRLAFTS